MRSPRSVFVGIAAATSLLIYLGYSNLSKNQVLHAMELKVEMLQRTRDQMTAQLQVVTEHRQRLEQSLENYKNKLQAVKEEAEKQRNNLKTTLDEANQRLRREAMQRRQAEEAMEASRLEHERAYDELQKAKDDEIQRLAESLGTQQRWCKQLQEKLDECSKLKEAEAHLVLGAAQVEGQGSMPAEAADGRQMRKQGAVPQSDYRQDLVQRFSAASDEPPPAGAGGFLLPPLQQQQPQAGRAGRAVAQAQVHNREVADFGRRQAAQGLAARDGVKSDVGLQRDSALGKNKPDRMQGQGAAGSPPLLPGPQPSRIAVQSDRVADAGRGLIGEDYKGHHRQRAHDADEAAVDPREHQSNGNLIRDQLDNETEDDVDTKGRAALDHRPVLDRDFGKDS